MIAWKRRRTPAATPRPWIAAALEACALGLSDPAHEELILTALRAAEPGIRADERQECASRIRLRADWLDVLPDNGTFRGGLRAAADLIAGLLAGTRACTLCGADGHLAVVLARDLDTGEVSEEWRCEDVQACLARQFPELAADGEAPT